PEESPRFSSSTKIAEHGAWPIAREPAAIWRAPVQCTVRRSKDRRVRQRLEWSAAALPVPASGSTQSAAPCRRRGRTESCCPRTFGRRATCKAIVSPLGAYGQRAFLFHWAFRETLPSGNFPRSRPQKCGDAK